MIKYSTFDQLYDINNHFLYDLIKYFCGSINNNI